VRKFEDILRDKLYEAKSDFPDSIWDDIKNEIPIEKSKPGNALWIGFFLFSFAFVILTINKYPAWKVETPAAPSAELNAVEYYGFISSIHDIQNISYNNPTVAINVDNQSKVNIAESSSSSNTFLPSEGATSKVTILKASVPKRTMLDIPQVDQTKMRNLVDFNPLEFNAVQPLTVKKKRLPILNSSKEEVYCEIHQGAKPEYYLGSRHISSYAFNSLRAKSEGLNEYTKSRLRSESKKYSFSDEINFGASFRNGYFAEIGVRYDQINEKFNYKDYNASGSATFINNDTISIGGNPEAISDTIITDVAGVREVVNHNKFRKISIPVSIGYEFPLNKKVTVAGKAGLLVNVWSKYEGKMFDESGAIADIGEIQKSRNPFFRSLVHSATASVYLQYNVNNNLQLISGLNGYKNLGSTSHEFYGVEQKYSSLGLFVGAKYLL